jgi:hypothetical protein
MNRVMMDHLNRELHGVQKLADNSLLYSDKEAAIDVCCTVDVAKRVLHGKMQTFGADDFVFKVGSTKTSRTFG